MAILRILIISGILFTHNTTLADEWVDNWLKESSVSKPNAFETQKRGYVTAGGIKTRFKNENDHLVSVNPPSFKTGCGGIDIFLGSVGYLDADRLMAKFEKIVSGAVATYAFDLALNVLCTSCAKELQSLEGLMERLNKLQMDDCKASKALVAYMKNETGEGDSAANTEAINDFALSTGVEDLYNDSTDKNKNQTAAQARTNEGISSSSLIEECEADQKDVYFTPGLLLDNIAKKTNAKTNVNLMRGIVGDIEISSELTFTRIAPCHQNATLTAGMIINGEMYAMDESKSCSAIGSIKIGGASYPSLYAWAAKNIESILDTMISKGDYNLAQQQFINECAGPLLAALKFEIFQRQGAVPSALLKKEIVDKYTDWVTEGYAYSMTRDLIGSTISLIDMARTVSTNNPKKSNKCNPAIASVARTEIDSMIKAARDIKTTIQEDENNYHTTLLTRMLESMMYESMSQKTDNRTGADISQGVKN